MSTITYLTNEQIINYIFKRLSKEEDDKISVFLSENDDYDFAINALMDYCIENNIGYDELEKDFSETSYQDILLRFNENLKNKNKLRSYPMLKYSIAASLVSILVASVLLVIYLSSQRQVQKLLAQNNVLKDSIALITQFSQNNDVRKLLDEKNKQVNEYKLIAEANLPNTEYESKRTAILTQRSTTIDVISPKPNQFYKAAASITFDWKEDLGPTTFKLINNSGITVFIKKAAKNTVTIPKDTLLPGLYYWQLESARDILYIDRIVITK